MARRDEQGDSDIRVDHWEPAAGDDQAVDDRMPAEEHR